MELQDAVKIVKEGNLKARSLFELWEIEQVLRDAGDSEMLAKFQKEFTAEEMTAADAKAKVEIEARQNELQDIKENYVEDEDFQKNMDNFWSSLNIVNNDASVDKVKAGDLRRQIEEISAHEAEREILEGKSPKDYKKILHAKIEAN